MLENYENNVNLQEHMKQYILMRRITPGTNHNLLARKGIVTKASTISELGFYGIVIADYEDIKVNEYAGYLLRTKASDANEGGVAAGFAVLDSLYLE